MSGARFAVERRSIDVVPDDERHGRVHNQFTLWFGGNLQITAVVTGALAVVFGAVPLWAIVGLVIGNIAGGAVMALHSIQGPRLGLPQMISSRAQFGVYGAVVPLILVILLYIGFFASGTVLAGQATGALLHINDAAGIIIFGVLTAVIAVVGYRLIHVMGRISTVIGAIGFIYLGVRLFTRYDVAALLGNHTFDFPLFLLAISLSASWQLAFGPYVADYSRYLPRSVKPAATFWSTLAGSALGSQLSMTLGALAAAAAGDAFLGHEVSFVVGLGGTGLIAVILYLVIVIGKLTINVLNAYGGFMSLVTTVSGFAGQRQLGRVGRALYIAVIMVLGTVLALLGRGNFLDSFSTFLLFLLTFFTPWSAVNLVDYYLISKERYDVPALADPHGRYGRWRTPALVSYVVGVLIQLPFLSTELFTGPLVGPLGGADISWLLGLLITGALYYLLARGRSVAPEELILFEHPDAVQEPAR